VPTMFFGEKGMLFKKKKKKTFTNIWQMRKWEIERVDTLP
jgi:hypothetical protein